MADYGVQATQLADPQGQGANIIKPIHETPTGATDNYGNIAQVFEKISAGYVKQKADERKAAVVGQFVKAENYHTSALEQGIPAAAIAARSRANFGMFTSQYPEYVTELTEAARSLRGFGNAEAVDKKIISEASQRQDDIKAASSRGTVFIAGMSKSAEDDAIRADKSALLAEHERKELFSRNAEERAQGTYDAGVAAREEKEMAVKTINLIASDNLTAFQSFSKTLGDNVRSGKMKPEEAQVVLSERFSNISAAIVAASRVNPELVTPYRQLFDEMNKVGQKLIDPKQVNDQLEDEIKAIKNRMKLVALSNPKYAGVIVANELLPNNASLAMSSLGVATEMVSTLSSKPVSAKVPQVVGEDSEPDTLRLLKAGISSLNSGKVKNPELAAVQASNSANHILKQVGRELDKGVPPEQLKGVASFFASPEYAGLIQKGKIDQDAALAAKKTFQVLYEPAIIDGVSKRLNAPLMTEEDISKGQLSPSQKQPMLDSNGNVIQLKDNTGSNPKAIDMVDIKFGGSGVIFVEKPVTQPLTQAEMAKQKEVMSSLKAAQSGLNQILHIGAHMEGSTNYSQYWEENKHNLLPGIYPAPSRLKVGQVVDGYKYIGGDVKSPSNWEKQIDDKPNE